MLFWIGFFLGLIYGYMQPGKEDRWGLLKKGILYAIILAIVFGLLGYFLGGSLPSWLFIFGTGFVGVFINVVLFAIVFIIGTFIGDFLESKLKK